MVAVSALLGLASLEPLLIVVVVVRREVGCFSPAPRGLLNPFLVDGLEMDFGFISRELGGCSLQEANAPEACSDK